MKTGVKVCDAMTKKPIVVSPDENLRSCAKKMLKQRVGSLIVKENHKLVGIVTEKDFVEKVIAQNKDPGKTKVKDVMKKKIVTINPEEDIFDALKKMNKEKVRRLPVVANEKIVGLLTSKDILSIQPQLFENFMEKLDIREQEEKISNINQGICDNCGSYGIIYKMNNRRLCEACR